MHIQQSIFACPQCGKEGRSVGNATIKCLISVSLHRVKDIAHRFCGSADCPVVYYAEDSSERFYIQDLRERVYQKEPTIEDILVCYCFFHTLEDILVSIRDGEQSEIINDIKYGIQQGHCACDWRNPQGTCCLGNVTKIVRATRGCED